MAVRWRIGTLLGKRRIAIIFAFNDPAGAELIIAVRAMGLVREGSKT